MPASESLRSVIDAGRASKRLDELSIARVIKTIAEQAHAAQQKSGKAAGPFAPAAIAIDSRGAATLGAADASATYAAPEQRTGEGDRRSDVFSLGAVMWEALTSEPFDGTRPAASPLELNANIPAELAAICMRAIAQSPADRYHSAKVMAAEIEAVLEEAGYPDDDEKIAAYVTELAKRASAPQPPLVPMAPVLPKAAVEAKPAEVPLVPLVPRPPVLPASVKLGPIPGATIDEPKPAAKTEEPKPDPAAVVALPRARRDSSEVLGGWGWSGDASDAPVSDEYDDEPSSSKKTLTYVVGGGVAVAALITIIALASGGRSGSSPKQPVLAAAAPHVAQEPAVAAPPPAPSPSPEAAPTPPPVAAAPPEAAPTPPPVAAAPPEAARPPPAARPPAAPSSKHAPPGPPQLAAAFPDEKPHHAERVARVDPPKPRIDVDAAYRQGLQAYLHGDAQGALASLRSAASANPNYAPAWRGLGLVYEKLAAKDQARAAYKHYLKLAPSAPDADNIRNRLERL